MINTIFLSQREAHLVSKMAIVWIEIELEAVTDSMLS